LRRTSAAATATYDLAAIAEGMGCPALRISEHEDLLHILDDVIPGLGARTGPLLLDVRISPHH
jgi:benzoylformate decarboxylase